MLPSNQILRRFLHNIEASFSIYFNPNFSVEKSAPGDDDPDPYGQDGVINPDLQIVWQFAASAAVADFAFQLHNPG
jgi:hypothetical protein